MGAADLLTRLRAAGVTLRVEGPKLVARPSAALDDDIRATIRAHRDELVAALSVSGGQSSTAWTSKQVAAFEARRDRLLAWGWPTAEAERVADRLTRRDADDDRRSCADCRNYRPGRCVAYRAAGLHRPEIGRDLAGMLQRCPAFEEGSA